MTITNDVTSAKKETTNAELRFAADEINKSDSRPKTYQKQIPEKVRRQVGKYVFIFETSSTIGKFSLKYPKYCLTRTSVNNWKNKFKAGSDDVVLKQVGRPNILTQNIRKSNDTQLELGKLAARLKEDQL